MSESNLKPILITIERRDGGCDYAVSLDGPNPSASSDLYFECENLGDAEGLMGVIESTCTSVDDVRSVVAELADLP